MLFILDPQWLEVAVVSVLALIVGAYCDRRDVRFMRLVARQGEKKDEWLLANRAEATKILFFRLCGRAPLIEEVSFRAVPIWLFVRGYQEYAIWFGLILNVFFTAIHFPLKSVQAYVRIFLGGLLELAAGLLTGLLIVSIIVHALWNFCAMWKVGIIARDPQKRVRLRA